MRVKVSEATGVVLDCLVAKCELPIESALVNTFIGRHGRGEFPYSTNWAQGGPIIEREEFCVPTRYYGCAESNPDKWQAGFGVYSWVRGSTPLIAAMRCYVASKLGEEVEVPDELLENKQ